MSSCHVVFVCLSVCVWVGQPLLCWDFNWRCGKAPERASFSMRWRLRQRQRCSTSFRTRLRWVFWNQCARYALRAANVLRILCTNEYQLNSIIYARGLRCVWWMIAADFQFRCRRQSNGGQTLDSTPHARVALSASLSFDENISNCAVLKLVRVSLHKHAIWYLCSFLFCIIQSECDYVSKREKLIVVLRIALV